MLKYGGTGTHQVRDPGMGNATSLAADGKQGQKQKIWGQRSLAGEKEGAEHAGAEHRGSAHSLQHHVQHPTETLLL